MIHIASPGRAKIIGVKVNSVGLMKIKVLSTATNNLNEKLAVKAGESTVVISKDIPLTKYQNTMASFPVGRGSVVNIDYITEKGASGKFSVESQKLLPL